MCNTPHSPLRENTKLWNRTALECYEIGCNCSKCFIYHTFFEGSEDICCMKYYVEKLVNKLGKPEVC